MSVARDAFEALVADVQLVAERGSGVVRLQRFEDRAAGEEGEREREARTRGFAPRSNQNRHDAPQRRN